MLVRVCGPKNKDTEELIANNFNNAQLIFQCLFWVSLQTSTFVKFGLFAKGNTKKK